MEPCEVLFIAYILVWSILDLSFWPETPSGIVLKQLTITQQRKINTNSCRIWIISIARLAYECLVTIVTKFTDNNRMKEISWNLRKPMEHYLCCHWMSSVCVRSPGFCFLWLYLLAVGTGVEFGVPFQNSSLALCINSLRGPCIGFNPVFLFLEV